MVDTLEVLLVWFLVVYVLLLILDEILYLSRGYRVVRYEPKRKFEVIDFRNLRRNRKW